MSDNISIRALTKRYEKFTLDKVSFSVPAGAVVGFVGENGAGKSTTIKCLLGLVNADGGSVVIFGKEASSLTRGERGRIGAVLGETCLPENLTLKDIDGVMRHVFSAWNGAQFFALAQRFALPTDKKVREFSRGMRQKVSLAVALSHGAEILVLDEPTDGLDPVARDEILEILYDFMQEEKHSVLISSHIVTDLEKLCDYIAFLHEGKLVFFEEKDRLSEKYAILHTDESSLKKLDAASIVAVRRGEFGTSALVLRKKMPQDTPLDRAGIEEIMLYYAKGEKIAREGMEEKRCSVV